MKTMAIALAIALCGCCRMTPAEREHLENQRMYLRNWQLQNAAMPVLNAPVQSAIYEARASSWQQKHGHWTSGNLEPDNN